MTGQPLVIEGIGKTYGTHRALSKVSATLAPGSINAVLGPNGAGKSTLLGILATLVRPTTGSLRWGNQLLTPGSDARSSIGYVGHEPGLYPDLGARSNLQLFAALHGLPLTGQDVGVHLANVGLTEALDGRIEVPVRAFSRGMQQRLALARALLHAPPILLFDEPSAALDPAGAAWLTRQLGEQRAAGRIVVLITHDLGLAASIADRVLLLRRGRMVLDRPVKIGSGEDLRALYQEATGVPA